MKYKNTLYPYFFGIFMLKKIFIWENNTYFNNYIWYFINLKRVIFHFFIKKFENIFWFNNYFIPLNHIFIFIYLFICFYALMVWLSTIQQLEGILGNHIINVKFNVNIKDSLESWKETQKSNQPQPSPLSFQEASVADQWKTFGYVW